MSDTATLVERLRVGLMAVAAFVRGNVDAKTRVKAALDTIDETAARIAELEAERDRFKAALTRLDNGDWLGLDAHEIIRATLTDPSG